MKILSHLIGYIHFKVDNREDFIKMMAANGVIASELHKRNDLHTYLNDFPAQLPNLDKFYQKMVHIPCGWWVTEEQRKVYSQSDRKGLVVKFEFYKSIDGLRFF